MEKAITQPIKQLFKELVKQHFNDNDKIKVTIEALQNLLKNDAKKSIHPLIQELIRINKMFTNQQRQLQNIKKMVDDENYKNKLFNEQGKYFKNKNLLIKKSLDLNNQPQQIKKYIISEASEEEKYIYNQFVNDEQYRNFINYYQLNLKQQDC